MMRLPVDEVIISLPLKSQFANIEHIVQVCGRAGIQAQYSLDVFAAETPSVHGVNLSEGHRVTMQMVNQDHRMYLKEVVDRTLSAIGLLLLSPLLLVVALVIKLSSPGPVFFVQQRFGLHKRRFGMIKFRSNVPTGLRGRAAGMATALGQTVAAITPAGAVKE